MTLYDVAGAAVISLCVVLIGVAVGWIVAWVDARQHASTAPPDEVKGPPPSYVTVEALGAFNNREWAHVVVYDYVNGHLRQTELRYDVTIDELYHYGGHNHAQSLDDDEDERVMSLIRQEEARRNAIYLTKLRVESWQAFDADQEE